MDTTTMMDYMRRIMKADGWKTESSVGVVESGQFGRVMVAERDIEAGELLYREPCLVTAPQGGAEPTCLRCTKNLSNQDTSRCSGCRAPICTVNHTNEGKLSNNGNDVTNGPINCTNGTDVSCTNGTDDKSTNGVDVKGTDVGGTNRTDISGTNGTDINGTDGTDVDQTENTCETSCNNLYHSQEECDILSSYKGEWGPKKTQIINALLTPLRTFLVVGQSDENSAIFHTMQSDTEHRSSLPIGRFIDNAIVPMLLNVIHCKNITKEFIRRAFGVFDTNCFNVSAEDTTARGLLPLTGMMMNACRPNSDHWYSEGKMHVRASVDIKKGSLVTTNYSSCLTSTTFRRKLLRLTKLFVCGCERCLHPTEFDTYIGAPRCRSCKTGFCVYNDKIYKCNNCPATLTEEQLQMLTNTLNCKPTFQNMEEILMKISFGKKLVGENHFSVLQLMTAWLRLFSNSSVTERTTAELQTALEMSEQMMRVVKVLEPGLSLLTGEYLISNLMARAELSRRKTDCQNGQSCNSSAETNGKSDNNSSETNGKCDNSLPEIDLNEAKEIGERVELAQRIFKNHPSACRIESLLPYLHCVKT